MKMIVNESSRVTIKVLDADNKTVAKISVGKRAKVEAAKELADQYDIDIFEYNEKARHVGGAGIWSTMRFESFDLLMRDGFAIY